MLQSELFPKTRKHPPSDAESINHKLLVQAGFIDQLMSGSWTLLPLGLKVVKKINNVIREEINNVGGQEVTMPLLHPKSIWNETGRWKKADEIMYKLQDSRGKDHVLSFTHEEIIMDLLRKHIKSYKDLPVALYQFSTKFRNEPRARSGVLRGREFLMKDLYSAHSTDKDLMDYYEKVKNAYLKIFQRLGFNVKVAKASGGVFTDKNTHEFQVISEGGEDLIYYCEKCDWCVNQEIFQGSEGADCPKCGEKIRSDKSIEVGNIFPLGTWYAEKMEVYYVDDNGDKKPVWFGSYGIGPTRTMGAWVEVSHDNNGIVWNKTISPFDAHLLALEGASNAKKAYEKLLNSGIDVLFDDRNISAGEKFTDCDLIGIPVRLVVSQETGDKIEWKYRDSQEKILMTTDEVTDKILKDDKQ